MNIPAHRAAAVEPTPADTFEVKDGKTINLTEQARAASESAEASAKPAKVAAEPTKAASEPKKEA